MFSYFIWFSDIFYGLSLLRWRLILRIIYCCNPTLIRKFWASLILWILIRALILKWAAKSLSRKYFTTTFALWIYWCIFNLFFNFIFYFFFFLIFTDFSVSKEFLLLVDQILPILCFFTLTYTTNYYTGKNNYNCRYCSYYFFIIIPMFFTHFNNLIILKKLIFQKIKKFYFNQFYFPTSKLKKWIRNTTLIWKTSIMIKGGIIRMKVSKDKITTEIMKIDFEFQQEITKIRISIQTRLKGKN